MALKTLLDFSMIASGNQQQKHQLLPEFQDDIDGSGTLEVLKRILDLASRITGNNHGSIGLHPAVYFYGPTGQHQAPMFMGTALLLKKKMLANDPKFFQTFVSRRERLEQVLVDYKPTIATILQGYVSKHRVERYSQFLQNLIDRLGESEEPITNEEVVSMSGLAGKIFVGSGSTSSPTFSDDVKSEVFIRKAIESAMRCPICKGYLDPKKSISYDHIVRRREGGTGDISNCDIAHPFCNQSIKN